ncbi:hypothetical protein AB4G91_03195 [Macrococcoides goetzii]|uniref:hypothetical protein n=1 Tax=Macrococcus TaxID=69965 RepID=UPI001EF1CDC3|nr:MULTISPECIES: hypothetical protein [Macrococcus]MCG7421186.1 hypothetical protein [Macrococcus epidermidis]MCH4986233.1 hypothetical protein [Macrococcus sp. PK]
MVAEEKVNTYLGDVIIKHLSYNNPNLDKMNLVPPIFSLIISLAFVLVNIRTLSIRDELWVKIAVTISLIIFVAFTIVNIITIYLIIKRKSTNKK